MWTLEWGESERNILTLKQRKSWKQDFLRPWPSLYPSGPHVAWTNVKKEPNILQRNSHHHKLRKKYSVRTLGHVQIKRKITVPLLLYFSIQRKVLLNLCSQLVYIINLIQLIYLSSAQHGLYSQLQRMVYGFQQVSSFLVLSWVEHWEDFILTLFNKSSSTTVTQKWNRMHYLVLQQCFQVIVVWLIRLQFSCLKPRSQSIFSFQSSWQWLLHMVLPWFSINPCMRVHSEPSRSHSWSTTCQTKTWIWSEGS